MQIISISNEKCPVDWNISEFEEMMVTHLKKDEFEWKFYDELVKEWNAKHWRKKPLSAFLKFMLNKVELSLKS